MNRIILLGLFNVAYWCEVVFTSSTWPKQTPTAVTLHIPWTCQSPHAAIWLDGGEGFNLGCAWTRGMRAQCECATRKIRCAPNSLCSPARTFKDYILWFYILKTFVCLLGRYFLSIYRCVSRLRREKWDMITLPTESAVFSVVDLVWDKKRNLKPFPHSLPPADPQRQASRLPVKVLKMLSARTGHILHPDYLQPLPSTPVSPIEVQRTSSPQLKRVEIQSYVLEVIIKHLVLKKKKFFIK